MLADLIAGALPPAVAERARVAHEGARPGAYVLYWMRTAVRARDNPALDATLALAERLRLPAFVYHGLSERYPWASDRHHTFILEGARDVAAALAARGIGYAFHLERAGARGPHLRTLAARAALVVTEDMPVGFLSAWGDAVGAPLLAVDTACVVPMRLTARAHDRAFAFRRATERLRAERVERSWQDVEPASSAWLPDVPFEPLDLAGADVPALVASCAVDHGVAPVPHTPGGTTAGTARWEAFRDQRLRHYARDRNDPLRDGTSRLSAYLHYGHVSPLRLARESAAGGSAGAAKFLDELLVWRELAYHWCFHTPRHATIDALPAWARETLARHAADPRPALPSWETLARGRTGDPLWDAAQRSLLVHGELHNNVRMTWGKALLQWTPDTATALALLEDLNHRYALDGRDPASYGGLLWCLGLFDRPFTPEAPILGAVRPRPTRHHARRLDVAAYAARTGRPAVAHPPRVAVVGAGLAGLACARTLHDHGLAVTVLDRGRAPGGRLATRRQGGHVFDHGAQYFTARDARFVRAVRSWAHDGVVARWSGRLCVRDDDGTLAPMRDEARWVGTPDMRAVARHLAHDLTVRSGTAVTALERDGTAWRLHPDRGEFDVVLVAAQGPRAAELLAPVPALAARAAGARLAPCLAVMTAFAAPLDAGFDGATIAGSPLGWVACDSSKPGRPPGARWVLHATPAWSEAHLRDEPDAVALALRQALQDVVGRPLPPVVHCETQRWSHALVTVPVGDDCLWDASAGVGACGDWCLGGRLEAAYLSGVALAGRVLGTSR